MPLPLILHVGMPKTGTSSIQETLFHGLNDPRFRYIALGAANGSRAIQCLVGDQPLVGHLHEAQGIDADRMRQRATQFRQSWERQALRARQSGAIPIISAEDCWFLNRNELLRLRSMLEDMGFRARVVTYLRPPLAWVSSMFQELLKSGHRRFADQLLVVPPKVAADPQVFGCDYLHRLRLIEDVFGKDALTLRAFRRESLEGGCVVTDFCRCTGVRVSARSIRRVNDGMSLDATRFLYAYNRFRRMQQRLPFRDFLLILRRLQELPGPPLQLHPQVLGPVRELLEAQLPLLRTQYGVDLTEDWSSPDSEAVRTEEDLFRFTQRSLDWLAAGAGHSLASNCSGADAAHEVAQCVGRLRPRLRHRIEDHVIGRIRQFRLKRAER